MEAVAIPVSFFWPVALAALAVAFGAGGVVLQVRNFGNRLTRNDERWFEHVQGHAPKVAGGSDGPPLAGGGA